MAGVHDREKMVSMVKSQETGAFDVLGAFCRLVLAYAVGVTWKICLKLAGVSVVVKQLNELETLHFTRPEFVVAMELFQETVRELVEGY